MKEKLKKYLASSTAILTAGVAAHAQVVYTDIDPDIVVDSNNLNQDDFYYVDLNNDATNDFRFGMKNNEQNNATSSGGNLFSSFGAVWAIGSQAQNDVIFAYTISSAYDFFVDALNSGGVVNSAGNFASWGWLGIQSYWLFTDSTRNIPGGRGEAGLFPNQGDKYVAVRFSPNGTDIHYGWVRVNVNNRNRGFSIKDYAYEATPNTPITIGDKCSNVTIQDTVVSCDSALVNGTWYFTSQSISDTFTSAYGCDSIVVTDLTIQVGPTITTNMSATTTLFEWNDIQLVVNAANATAYQWQVNTGSGYSNITDSDTYNGGTYSGTNNDTLVMTNVSIANDGYKYRCVITGSCAPSTMDSTELQVDAATPGASYVKSPIDGKTNVRTWSTFYAQSITGATSYTLQISDDNTFNTIDYTFYSSNNKFSVSGLYYNITYYARVKTDLDQTFGTITDFTTIPLPLTYITSPSNGGEVELVDFAKVGWVDTDVDKIIFEFNTDPGFNPVTAVFDTNTAVASNINDRESNTFANIGLNSSQTYYMRARSLVSSLSLTGNWSSSRSFDVIGTNDKSYMTSPSDGSLDVRTFTGIVYKEIPGTSTYTIQVSSDPTFTVVDQTKSTNTYGAVTFSGFDYNTVYYVRVDADGGGFGTVYDFTTTATPICYVTNITDGQTNVALSKQAYVNWQDTDVDQIIFEFNTDPGFNPGTAIVDTAFGGIRVSKKYSLLGLLNSTTYYLRVHSNATSHAAFGNWSSTISFTTEPAADFSARTTNTNAEKDSKEVILNYDVYPNPFSNEIQLHVASKERSLMNVRVYDVLGTLKYSNENVYTNDVITFGSELEEGMYIVQVIYNDEVESFKVVKKK